jgi:hypothetical protein
VLGADGAERGVGGVHVLLEEVLPGGGVQPVAAVEQALGDPSGTERFAEAEVPHDGVHGVHVRGEGEAVGVFADQPVICLTVRHVADVTAVTGVTIPV